MTESSHSLHKIQTWAEVACRGVWTTSRANLATAARSVENAAIVTEIMVPLDGNRLAETAIPVAAALALRCRARLHLVAVSQPARTWRTGSGLPPEVPSDDLSGIDRITQRGLGCYPHRAASNVTKDTGLIVHAVLLEGAEPVAEQLLDYAGRHRIDLVVMQTHARSPGGRVWLGSVAHALVQQSGIPCLLLRGPAPQGSESEPPAGPARILMPLDGSPEADLALDLVLAIAQPDVTDLHLLAVITPGPLTARDQPSLPERIAARQEHLALLARRAGEAGIKAFSHLAIQSNPTQVILDTITRERIELLAIAAHHRSGRNLAISGSVIGHLLRHSQTPMLLWRSRQLHGISPHPVSHEPTTAQEP